MCIPFPNQIGAKLAAKGVDLEKLKITNPEFTKDIKQRGNQATPTEM